MYTVFWLCRTVTEVHTVLLTNTYVLYRYVLYECTERERERERKRLGEGEGCCVCVKGKGGYSQPLALKKRKIIRK